MQQGLQLQTDHVSSAKTKCIPNSPFGMAYTKPIQSLNCSCVKANPGVRNNSLISCSTSTLPFLTVIPDRAEQDAEINEEAAAAAAAAAATTEAAEGKEGKTVKNNEEGVPRGKGALTGLGVELVESDCLGAV